MGAYGNTEEAAISRADLQFVKFNLIGKVRLYRTVFVYVLGLSLKNIDDHDITDINVSLIDASEQVLSVYDDEITFPLIEAGEIVNSATIPDYFIAKIDRAKTIKPGRLTWQVNYTTVDGTETQIMSATFTIEIEDVDGDITGEGDVDFKDFAILASQWQQAPGTPSADIAPGEGDGIVDFHDLAFFVSLWLGSE